MVNDNASKINEINEYKCEINDISKTMFKDGKDFDEQFKKLSSYASVIIVHWRSHPDSDYYFTIKGASNWIHKSYKETEYIVNDLIKRGFVRKVDDMHYKTTDFNFAVYGN